MKWFVYILKCSDNSLYTGITNNIENRVTIHNQGKGAKYTRGRTPVILMAYWETDNKSNALKEEYRIKQLKKIDKLKLITLFKKKLVDFHHAEKS